MKSLIGWRQKIVELHPQPQIDNISSQRVVHLDATKSERKLMMKRED